MYVPAAGRGLSRSAVLEVLRSGDVDITPTTPLN